MEDFNEGLRQFDAVAALEHYSPATRAFAVLMDDCAAPMADDSAEISSCLAATCCSAAAFALSSEASALAL